MENAGRAGPVGLDRIPLFAHLDATQRGELASLLKEEKVQAQKPIFWIGEPGNEFYIIQRGQVEISLPDEKGQVVSLAILGPGQFFGELSLLDSGPRTATARAATEVTLLTLGQQDLHRFLQTHPSASIHMLAVLAQRLRETVDKLRGIENVNEVCQKSQTGWTRLTERLAAVTASESFVLMNLLFFGIWVTVNIFLQADAFDPSPFGLLEFYVSVEAILVTLIVLINQNRQGERDRIRADLDYQVNLKAHMEVMELHQKIDHVLSALDKSTAPASPTVPVADGDA